MRLKKTTIYSFLFLFFKLFSLQLNAQGVPITSGIKGVVMDASNKESIIGAAIYDLNDITHGATTDFNGNYQLRLNNGKHTIVCSFVSMKSDTIVVFTDSLKVIEHNFHLKSVATQLQTMVVSAGKY